MVMPNETTPLFERVHVNALIHVLETLTYDNVTCEKLKTNFPQHDIQDFYEETQYGEMKSFTIDDFTFKIYRPNEDICVGSSVYILNKTIEIDKDVEVWVSNGGDSEAQYNGTIGYDKETGRYTLTVEVELL